MGGLAQDIRYAVRVMLKSPGFTLVAVVVLALGIGVNTAIFSVVDAVLLRPLPFREPDRLMQLWHTPPPEQFHGMKKFSVSPGNYLDWQSQSNSFEQTAIYGFGKVNLTAGTGQPEAITVSRIQSTLLPLLGVNPLLGRNFTAAEDSAGQPDTIILSYGLWKNRFGGDPSIVGRDIDIDGEKRTIVGVMPQSFNFPTEAPVKMWTPLSWTEKQKAVRGNHNYLVIGRLKPGATQQQAQVELDTISARLQQADPADDKGWGALVETVREARTGDVRPALMMMLGAVAFVLLIACANVANLVLAKTLARQKEIAIRTALGASRSRVIRQALLETVLMSLAGGALGLVMAHYSIGLIMKFLGEELARTAVVNLDARILLFTLGISLVTGVVAGLLPALKLTKTNVNEALKQGLGRAGSDGSGNKTRAALVTVEMALSLILLVGAGLTVRSLWALRTVDPGVDPRNVLTMEVSIAGTNYPKAGQKSGYFNEVLRRIRAVPGVESAGSIDDLPVVSGGSTQPVSIEGQPQVPMAEQPEVPVRIISPGYLQSVHTDLKNGRDITDADNESATDVVLVSEAFAKRFWPGENAVGKRLNLFFYGPKMWQVVGIARDVKVNGLEEQTLPMVYMPLTQALTAFEERGEPLKDYGVTLVVRTSMKPEAVSSSVIDAIHQMNAQQPVLNVAAYESLMSEALSQRRLNVILLASFAGLAMLLAAMGIYSVLAYAVRRRMREIGIRMALGAQIGDVLRMIVAEGLKPTLLGVAIGLVGALALGRLMTALVYGVSPTDPATMAAVASLLVAVGIAASVIPAWRATKVEPVQILRDE